jgi:hypothetical protein
MNLRKPLIVIALVALGVVIPASSAMAWTNPDDYTLTNTGGATNPLVSTVQSANLPTISCDTLEFDVTLEAGFQDFGSVNEPATTDDCETNIPNCTVAVTTDFTDDWTLADNLLTANNNIQVNFVSFTATFAGGSCPLNGVAVTVQGNVDADVSYPDGDCNIGDQRTQADFDNADGMDVTTSTGGAVRRGTPVRLDGFVETECLTDNPEMESGTS